MQAATDAGDEPSYRRPRTKTFGTHGTKAPFQNEERRRHEAEVIYFPQLGPEMIGVLIPSPEGTGQDRNGHQQRGEVFWHRGQPSTTRLPLFSYVQAHL